MAISLKCLALVFILASVPVDGYWWKWWRKWNLKTDLHLTYNTALLDFSLALGNVSNNRVERRDEMIDILKKSRADLVCLQEVWIGQDVETFVQELDNKFPYSYSGLHNDNGDLPPQANGLQDPACDINLVIAFRDCANASGCLDNQASQALCAVQNCPAEFGAILTTQEECVTCTFTMLPRSVEEVFSECTAPAPTIGLRNMNKLGLLLLSKKPLSNLSFTEFHQIPALIERGYLEATYDDYLKVVCTHLTSPDNRGFQEPLLPFANSTEQALFEAGELVEKFKHEDPFLLLGDLNTGLEFRTGITPIVPDIYNVLLDRFSRTQPSDKCTFCPDTENVYNTGQEGERSVIDHIMGTGLKFFPGRRAFVFPQSSVTDNGVDVPLSDHFGYASRSWYFERRRRGNSLFGKRGELDNVDNEIRDLLDKLSNYD